MLKNIVPFEQWGLKVLKFCENVVKIFPEAQNNEPGIWKRNHGDGIFERRFQVIDLKKSNISNNTRSNRSLGECIWYVC